jgi:hypothetical protein
MMVQRNNKDSKMRKIILSIDLLLMIILSLYIILRIILLEIGIYNFSWPDDILLGLYLFYYSIAKSILGIILFGKNIIQKNIVITPKKILFLFIPSLLLIIFIGYFILSRLLEGAYVGEKIMFQSIILIIGIITLLAYLILNKTFTNKIYYNIILAIILPISYFIGYWLMWAIMMA